MRIVIDMSLRPISSAFSAISTFRSHPIMAPSTCLHKGRSMTRKSFAVRVGILKHCAPCSCHPPQQHPVKLNPLYQNN
jgi:hypothetical protein